MKKLSALLVFILVIAVAVVSLVACDRKDGEGRIMLSAPKNVAIQGDTLSWTPNKHTDRYEVEIAYPDGSTAKDEFDGAFYTVASKLQGKHSVRVRCIGDDKTTVTTDNWSKALEFTKTNQLTTPNNLSFTGDTKILSWNKVEGATGYSVDHNGETYSVSGNEGVNGKITYDFSSVISTDSPSANNFKVRALCSDGTYRDSQWSVQPVNYIVTGTLAAPTGVTVGTDNYVKWEKGDENATKFIIRAARIKEAGESDTEEGVNAVYEYTSNSSTQTSVSLTNLKILKEGRYNVTVTAVSNSYLYPQSATSAEPAVITKMTRVNEGDFKFIYQTDFTDVTKNVARLYWDDFSADDTVTKVTVIFRQPGSSSNVYSYDINKNEESKQIASTLDLLNEETVRNALRDSHGGKVLDIYIKVSGSGDGVLDSEETKFVSVANNGDYQSPVPGDDNGYATGYIAAKEPAKDDNGIYKITNAAKLAYMYYQPQADYRLENNISMSNTEVYPVGNANVPFTGTFDGNGKSIYNFKITQFYNKSDAAGASNEAFKNVGFFGYTQNATIKNLALLNVTVSTSKAVDSAGILVGTANNTAISMCDVSGSVNAQRGTNVGGVVGYAQKGADTNGKIEFSTASLSGTVYGKSSAGGFVGLNEVAITGSSVYFTRVIAVVAEADTYLYAGGFVGRNEAEITGSFARGDSVVSNLSVSARNSYLGGFVGYNSGNISGSYSNTKISSYAGIGTGSGFAGGFAGYNITASINDCYAVGVSEGSVPIGGFVGLLAGGTVNSSFASVNIKASPRNGAFIAKVQGSPVVTRCYYNWERSKASNGKRIGSPVAEGYTGQLSITGKYNDGTGYTLQAKDEIYTYGEIIPVDSANFGAIVNGGSVNNVFIDTIDGERLTVETYSLEAGLTTGKFTYDSAYPIALDGSTVTMPLLSDMLYLDFYRYRNKTVSYKTEPKDGSASARGEFYGVAYRPGAAAEAGVAPDRTVYPPEEGVDTTVSGAKYVLSYTVVRDGNVVARITRYITIS